VQTSPTEGEQKSGALSDQVEHIVPSATTETAVPNVAPDNSASVALSETPATSPSPENEPMSSALGQQDRLSVLLVRQEQVRKEADHLRELQRLEEEDQQLQVEIEKLRGSSHKK
jgi:hypothetical protein